MHKRLMLASLVLMTFFCAACSDLFDVENPGNLTLDDLNDPLLLDALKNTSEGRVCDAYQSLATANDLQADGFTFIGSFTFTELFMWGQHEGYNSEYNSRYNDMASARWVSDDMIKRLKASVASPTADQSVARAIFWNAIARIALADHFKEVPIDGKAPTAPAALLESVLPQLDEAAAVAGAANDKALQAAAILTKARVYRSLYFERNKTLSFFDQAMAAATQALTIQPTLSYACRYAQPGSNNGLSGLWLALTGTVLDPKYAVLNDPVSGQHDPRIKVGPPEGLAPSPHTGRLYKFYKFPDRNSPLPVARMAEGRLILAEGYLLKGDLANAVAQINLVRAAAALPPFASADAAAIYTQLKYERQVEFVGETRRLQDMRYYNIIPWQWTGNEQLAGVNRRWPVSTEEYAGNSFYGGLGG